MKFSHLHPRAIVARHHLNGHEKGAIIALSAVIGLFAIILTAVVYVWRTQRAGTTSKEVELGGEIKKATWKS